MLIGYARVSKNEQNLNLQVDSLIKAGVLEKKIFTDKFVTIHEQGDILYGTGLTANQDLSGYEILNIKGELEVKEE